MNARPRPRILATGWSSPPVTGMSVATDRLLDAEMTDSFEIRLLDLADRRGLGNMGRLDLPNLWLAAKHACRFSWLLATWRPQVVYIPIAQNRMGFLRDCLFLVPARLVGAPVVVHIHGGEYGRFIEVQPRWLRSLASFALERAAAVIVLGSGLRGIVAAVPDASVWVVPNGIEVTPEPMPLKEDGTVLWLSNITQGKGVLTVLGAAAILGRRHVNARFIFAGSWRNPTLRAEALDCVAEHSIEEMVEFVGPADDFEKERLFREARVFVLPSVSEGQPYAILEAMRAGRPVISTRVGAVADMVQHGGTGFLIEPGDSEGLAGAIETLLIDQDLAQRMGSAARNRFLEGFTVNRWHRDMKAVFHSVSRP